MAFLASALAVAALLVAPAQAEILCNVTSPCPSSAPCCSPFGFCGTDTFCQLGCEPNFSYRETACKPLALCQDATHTFTSFDKITNATKYSGNATKWDWVIETGNPVLDPNGEGMRLTLDKKGGTRISSTRYIHYGQIDFEMKVTANNGLVSSAITMSDVRDEIDWEWTTDALNEAQSNYFFLGIANYSETDGLTHKMNTSGFNINKDFHTYSFIWLPDSLTWAIDGQPIRTLNKADTIKADGKAHYPTTPSRIQIALWSTEGMAEGTVTWSGGAVDWSAPEFVANNYFYNTLKSVTIKCDTSADNIQPDTQGYTYAGNDTNGVPMVAVTNHTTLLRSGSVRGAVPTVGTAFLGLTAAVLVGIPSLAFVLF